MATCLEVEASDIRNDLGLTFWKQGLDRNRLKVLLKHCPASLSSNSRNERIFAIEIWKVERLKLAQRHGQVFTDNLPIPLLSLSPLSCTAGY